MNFNGFQKISTSWIDPKFLLYKLEEKAHIFQQLSLNLDIGCKNYNTSRDYVRTLLVSLGIEGLREE